MEDKYGDAKRRFDRLRKEKGDADVKLKESEDLVGHQRSIISEISGSYRKAKALCRKKQEKLRDYRGRVERANESIRRMKGELGDNAVEMFLASDEFAEMQEVIFDKAVDDVRKLLLRSYPDFDFSSFDADVKKATDNRKRAEPVSVADMSGTFLEEPLSENEPEAVSDDDERFVPERPVDGAAGKE